MADEDIEIRQEPPLPARINRKMVIAFVGITALLILLFATIGVKQTSRNEAKEEDEGLSTMALPPDMTIVDYKAWLEKKAKSEEPVKATVEPPKTLQPRAEDQGRHFKIPTDGSINVLPVTDTPAFKEMMRKLDHLASQVSGLENRRGATVPPPPNVARGVGMDEAMNSVFGSDLSFKEANISKMLKSAGGLASQTPEKTVNRSRSTPSAQTASAAAQVSSRGAILIGMDDTAKQGMQGEKRAFVDSMRTNETIYMVDELHRPKSRYELKASSIIPVTLYTGINSDLPGKIVAKVRNNVYDTIAGDWLLIPQGASLIGEYDSVIAYGQERILIAFSRIIFPNGNSINLEGAPGIDLSGYAGLKDRVNHHWLRLVTGVVLSALVTASASEATNAEVFLQSAAEQTGEIGQAIAEKNLNIAPTITIRPGWRFNVFIHKDIVLEPYTGETIFAKSNG